MPVIKTGKDKKISKNLRFLLIALVVSIVAVVAVLVAMLNTRKSGIELQYGDYSITKERYAELIKEAQSANVSSEDAREVLINSLKAQAAAKDVGLDESSYMSVAAAAAFRQAGKKIDNMAEESYYQRAQYVKAIDSELDYLSKGGYEFATFEFPFTKRINEALLNVVADKEGLKEKLGREEYIKKRASELSHDKIREDVAYAKSAAEKYHQALKDKKISPQTAVNEIRSDKRLGHGGVANTSAIHYVPMDGVKDTVIGRTIDYRVTKLTLDKMKPGDITPIQDVVGPPYLFSYPDELNVEGGARSGYSFMYYISKDEADKGIKERYKKALEGK
ncbi:hypothetical protein GX865_03340 [Candidatus Saccharibacteria bacterium]|jgi:flagellar basal body-associated protein FliL|nr:hypothetical protein [Candidatus Saccharibacteria bacterium]